MSHKTAKNASLKAAPKAPSPSAPKPKTPAFAPVPRPTQPRPTTKPPPKAPTPIKSAVPNPQSKLRPVKSIVPQTNKQHGLVRNHYLESLLDPFHVTGTKIPDIDFSESGTMHIRQIVQAKTGTHGIIGIYLGGGVGPGTYSSLQPSSTECSFGNASDTTLCIGAQCGSEAAESSPFAVAAGATGVGALKLADAQSGLLGQVFSDFRVVSVGIVAECASSYANLQGYTMVGSFPKAALYDVTLAAQSVTALLNSPYTMSQPASFGPLQAVYTPTDESCFDYRDLDREYNDYNVARNEDIGGLLAMFYGMPVDQPVQFTICFNLEYLPKYGSLALGVSPSPVDRDAVDSAINELEQIDACGSAKPVGAISGNDSVVSSADLQIAMGSVSNGRNLVRTNRTPPFKLGAPAPAQVRVDSVPQKSMLSQLGDFLLKVAKKAAPALVSGIVGLL